MGKKICPVCGYVDESGAGYCRQCGAKMEDAESTQQNQYSSYQDGAADSYYQSQSSGGYGTGQGGQYSGQSGQSYSSGGASQSNQYNNYQDYTSNMSYRPPVEEYRPEGGTNGLQIAGLVCGILAICSCCCYGVPAVILGIAGIVCASMGNKRGRSGVGTAGFICSIIGLILGIISSVYYAWVLSQMSRMDYYEIQQLLDMF